jgi:hypothetical protein
VRFAYSVANALDMEKRYWNHVLWSPSYFAASCGGAPLGILEQYVERQKTPLSRALYPRPKGPGLYGPSGNYRLPRSQHVIVEDCLVRLIERKERVGCCASNQQQGRSKSCKDTCDPGLHICTTKK